MENEQRPANVIFNKSGGTASKNAVTTRITVPSSWIKDMGIGSDCRSVILEYDSKTKSITVRKGGNG